MYADRILRDVFNLIDATLRTNFHRRRDMADYFIALKISSLGVIAMPSPKPFIEIYVHSRTMEGIHLRGAKVVLSISVSMGSVSLSVQSDGRDMP